MKTHTLILTGALLIPFMTGCISKAPSLAAVGPDASFRPALAGNSNGRLQVFTATEQRADEITTLWYHGYSYPHTSYEIEDQSGATVKYVPNHASIMDETPDMVKLPLGNYIVVAESSRKGLVKVPVSIEPGKTTVVRLDSN